MARNLVHRTAGVKASAGRQPQKPPRATVKGMGRNAAAKPHTKTSNPNGQSRHK